VPKRDRSVLEAEKTTFGLRYGFSDFISFFLYELGTCVQNPIFTEGVEGCQNNYFPQRGMLKFKYKGHYLQNKRAYKETIYSKSKW
jgi:hypothetical protein